MAMGQRTNNDQGRQSLLEALARLYTPRLGRRINPKTEIIITPGAYAGQTPEHYTWGQA